MERLYNVDVDNVIELVKGGHDKPRLLLHTCCGPCACGVLANIAPYFDITAFYYNPNILPHEEWERRLDALKTVLDYFGGIKLVVPPQSEEDFLKRARGLEALPEGGERCTRCFDLRLNATGEYFSEHLDDFDFFATTLTVSPHKNAALINEIGEGIGELYDVPYLPSDFKKHDGFLKSTRLSKELGIYRQNYCGCLFTL